MLFYCFILIAIVILGAFLQTCRINRKVFLLLACLILSAIAGLRNQTVGADTGSYMQIYEMDFSVNSKYYQSLEIGFRVLVWISHIITENSSVFLFICSLISSAIICYSIYKWSPDYIFSVVLYLAMGYYFCSLNVVRQYLAVSLSVLAYHYILNRKKIKAILITVTAVLMHTSAVVSVLLYFQLYLLSENRKEIKTFFRKRQKVIVLGTVLSVFAGAFVLRDVVQYLLTYFERYYLMFVQDTYRYQTYFSKGYFYIAFINTAVWGFLVLFAPANSKVKRQFLLPASLAAIFSVFQLQINILARLVWYFDVYYIFVIPLILSENVFEPNSKKFVNRVVVVACLCLYIYFISHNYQLVVPYKIVG